MTPERAEARQFQERLAHAYSEGGFLVLTVRPSRMRPCEEELLRRFSDLQKVSFDDLLFESFGRKPRNSTSTGRSLSRRMRRNVPARTGRICWTWRGVAPNYRSNLLDRDQHLLLIHPGLIARYDQMSIWKRCGTRWATMPRVRDSGCWSPRTGRTTCRCWTMRRSRSSRQANGPRFPRRGSTMHIEVGQMTVAAVAGERKRGN